MIERRYEIKHKGPEIINAPLPKEHQSELHHFTLEIDGRPSVIGWLAEGETYFGFYWPRTSVSPSEFFASVQALGSALEKNGYEPHPQKQSPSKLTYTLNAENWPEVKTEDLSEVDALKDERLLLARFDTRFGGFSQERDSKESDVFIAAFLTHVYQPDELAQFIVDNCADNPPIELVKELLEKVQSTRLSQEAA